MKRVITFLILVLFCFGCHSQVEKNKIIHKIDFAFLEGCETGTGDCKPVTITRQSLSDIVSLVFPSGGTASGAYLHSDIEGKDSIIRQDNRMIGEGKPTLDLTGLPDGKYSANMISCGLGGGFELILITENK